MDLGSTSQGRWNGTHSECTTSMNAKLTSETQEDLLRGMEWFDKIAFGLGNQFESEFFVRLSESTRMQIYSQPTMPVTDHAD